MIIYYRGMVGRQLNCSGMGWHVWNHKHISLWIPAMPFLGIVIVAKREATAILP